MFCVDVDRWDPWAELRRRSHIIFGLCELPTGVRGLYVPEGDRSFILVNKTLNQCERNAVLAHELIHDELGGGCVLQGMPFQYRAVAAREERRIDVEVARRFIPHAELEAMRAVAAANGLPVEAWHVAEHFDVPQRYADLRLEMARAA